MLMCSDYLDRPFLWIDLVDPACSLQLKYVFVNEVEGVRVTILPRREAPLNGLDLDWAARAVIAAAARERGKFRLIRIYHPTPIGQPGNGYEDRVSDKLYESMCIIGGPAVASAVTFEYADSDSEPDKC